ncbi:hypothetical protein [Geomicrobium sediminis]|uniref:Uncharacterized protein n=1 Tax=Geomicrobium sediminis TaxID=1347788 RepID=A0ABS2PI09_9BACL|nr:hypothetical protein [Geomicrobium sediminis]MBM7634976.1 hypothetical protein [Geomicrobium sediminis]
MKNKYTSTDQENQPVAVFAATDDLEIATLKEVRSLYERLLILPWKSHTSTSRENGEITLTLYEKANQEGHEMYLLETTTKGKQVELHIVGGRGVDVFRQIPKVLTKQ